jgi:DNA-binding IclR family transcriptional regulator
VSAGRWYVDEQVLEFLASGEAMVVAVARAIDGGHGAAGRRRAHESLRRLQARGLVQYRDDDGIGRWSLTTNEEANS